MGREKGKRISLKRRIFLILGLAFLLAMPGLFLAELIVRVLFPVPLAETRDAAGRGMYHYQDGLRMLKPNYRGVCTAPEFRTKVESNSLGFRGGSFLAEKPEGTFRIFALGDSFTFGLGVETEEAFPARLERSLSKAGGRNVEVFNFGIPGYGTVEELKVLRRFAGYDPDLVMVGLLVQDRVSHGNDLMDNLRMTKKDERGGKKGGEQGAPSRSFPARVRDFLRRHSHLYRHFELRFGLSLRRWTANMKMGDPEVLARGWEVTFRLLLEMRDQAAGAGAEFLIIYIPFFSDIHNANREIAKRIEAFCREEGIHFCDLLPLHLRCKGDAMVYPLDLHWTREGHRLVAEEVHMSLSRLGLLPW